MKKQIEICMGSSCFVRGNRVFAKRIEEFVKENKSSIDITFRGCLCKEECNDGPNLRLNGELISNLTESKLEEILDSLDK